MPSEVDYYTDSEDDLLNKDGEQFAVNPPGLYVIGPDAHTFSPTLLANLRHDFIQIFRRTGGDKLTLFESARDRSYTEEYEADWRFNEYDPALGSAFRYSINPGDISSDHDSSSSEDSDSDSGRARSRPRLPTPPDSQRFAKAKKKKKKKTRDWPPSASRNEDSDSDDDRVKRLHPFSYHLHYLLYSMEKLVREALPRSLSRAYMDDKAPRVVIVNYYRPGAGIAQHVDSPKTYGKIIAGVSLDGPVNMHFTPATATTTTRDREEEGQEGNHCAAAAVVLPKRISQPSRTAHEFDAHKYEFQVELERASMYVLSGDARYAWKHGIPDVEYEPDLSLARSMQAEAGPDDSPPPVIWRKRGERISITVRTLRPGANVGGGAPSAPPSAKRARHN